MFSSGSRSRLVSFCGSGSPMFLTRANHRVTSWLVTAAGVSLDPAARCLALLLVQQECDGPDCASAADTIEACLASPLCCERTAGQKKSDAAGRRTHGYPLEPAATRDRA